jgi:hypothetical protein
MENDNSLYIVLDNPYRNVAAQKLCLPQLTILTGINGAGKTNFLSMFPEKKAYSVGGEKKPSISITKNRNDVKNVLHVRNDIPSLGLKITDLHERMLGALDYCKANIGELSRSYSHNLQYLRDLSARYEPLAPIIKATCAYLNKKLNELSWNDIEDTYAVIMASGDYDNAFFASNLTDIFVGYHNVHKENAIKLLRKKYHEEKNLDCFESEAEFEQTYGPQPWNVINNALLNAGLPYSVNYPEDKGPIYSFDLKIIDKERGIDIAPNMLSSGEKALFQIAISVFNTIKKSNFPELILCDEFDSTLHPEMIKKLLNIFINIFNWV